MLFMAGAGSRRSGNGENGQGWKTVLGAPAEGQHVAQLYTQADFLVRAVTHFVVAGLRRGEAVLLVVRTTHHPAIVRHLEDAGFGLEGLSRRGQVTLLDAAQTLGALLVDGRPDRARFQAVIGGAVEASLAAGYPRLRAFGEMVDILRPVSLTAALELEKLWNELLTARRISLLCGYSVDAFDPEAYRGLLQDVSAAHSHLVPVEDYARLDQAVDSAFVEIFGAARDARFFRRTFIDHYQRPAAMPDAQAAILATRQFVPEAVVALLDRARHHYHRLSPTA